MDSYMKLWAGPQPLRGLPGYPGQQAPQNRNTPLGSGRLQNGKLGNVPSWGFGLPANGAPGLPTPQGRTPVGASTSFAQTIGGSQPSTPLDLSEFPSLSGTSQTQHQNPSQAIWANANQRATQHTPVQRPQPQTQTNVPISTQTHQQTHQAQDQVQQSLDDAFSTTSQFSSGLDDYRHGGQSGVGQLSGSGQPQSSSIEEFPPLGRNGHGEIGQDRRGNMMQNAASGGYPAGSVFSQSLNQMPNRQTLPTGLTGQADSLHSTSLADRNMSPIAIGSGGLPTLRATGESIQAGQYGVSQQNKTAMSGLSQNGSNVDSLIASLSQTTLKPDHSTSQQLRQPPQGRPQPSRPQQHQTGFGADFVESPGDGRTRNQTPLSHMSELDRYGLAGLLDTIRNDDPDVTSLAIGHDLTQLGLDLNSSEPLWPTFGGPFAQFPTRPMQPDFTLPQCYTVHNVHKLEEKVPSFSDETLFYMFYTMPRDIMQEVAAIELTHRNWRYHKVLKVWLTKDPQFGDPAPVSNEAERGRYVVFNEKLWQRESRDMILRWADLDDHIQIRHAGAGMS
ncbi:hypothetical protein MMC24_000355 [Lignoscripta atroalba]|nr:hypothetical protein [Lignoscripta atroalba]